MNQIQLVAYLLLLTAHLCIAGVTETSVKTYHLQVVHNNDLHSRFEEMDVNAAPCPAEYVTDKKCFGGWARIKKAADDARDAATSKNIPSIFLNAGDNFQDTPYYTKFKSEIFIKMIDKLGFNAMSLGHHEFDDGIEELSKYLKGITTPVVCTNVDASKEEKFHLGDYFTTSTVIPVGKGENTRNICVIGYLTTKASREKTKPLIFNEEIPAIEKEAKRIKKDENCHFIIVLGHGGYEKDIKIAQEVKEINMVVGGDSHTLLYTKKSPDEPAPSIEDITADYPIKVEVKKIVKGKEQTVIVPVVQAFAYGKYLGILQVEFDEEGHVVDAHGNTELLDSKIEQDETIKNEVAEWTAKLKELIPNYKTIIGHTRVFLAKPKFDKATEFESTLANLITDAFVQYGVKRAFENDLETWTEAPISFYPTGGIRAILDNNRSHGALTVEDLMHLLPFQNDMFELAVLGSSLKRYLEASVELYDKHAITFEKTHYIHFSGLRVTYDFSKPVGERVESAEALCRKCSIPKYSPIDNDKFYHIITVRTEYNKFLKKIKATEMKATELKATKKKTDTEETDMEETEMEETEAKNIKDVDALADYIERIEIIAPHLDNRVIIKDFELGVAKPKPADEAVPMEEGENKDESAPMDVSSSTYGTSRFYLDASPLETKPADK